MRSYAILFVFLTSLCSALAQPVYFKGHIYAEETREPLAFANFYFGSSGLGFYSDFEGNFNLRSDSVPSDTLMVEYMGYETRYFHIRRDTINVFDIEMKRVFAQTSEVLIRLKANPALKWVKLAQDMRKQNNPDNLPYYSYETYTQSIIAINNINDRIKNGKIGKDIGKLFDTISYLSGDKSKSILPVFNSEVISDYYFNRNPYLSKEVIKASRISGIGVQDGTFISQFMGNSFVNYNFYQNTLTVADKGIMSPISESSFSIYDYSLVHVDKSGPRRVFQIYCEPKNSRDLAFHGFIWIEDTTGALLRLSLELNSNANLNYIEKLRVTQEYAPTDKTAFICVSTRAVIDAAELNTNMAGAVATVTNTVRNVDTDTKYPPKFFETRVTMAPGATNKADTFWDNHRHFPLDPAERRILGKIDTLVNLPRISAYVNVVNFLVDGYKKTNTIDIGPYYNLVSYNQWEGVRLRLGFRTSVRLSRNWITEGFVAYGLKDETWKYSLMAQHIFSRKHWTRAGFLVRKDVEQIGYTDNDNYISGLFTAFNMLGSNNVNMNRDFRLLFGTDIRNGLRLSVTLGNRYYQFKKVGSFNFAWLPNYPDSSWRRDFTNTTLNVTLRYAPRNYFLQNDNHRVNFGGIGPEYYATFIQGFKNVFHSEFNYTRAILGVTYYKVWGGIGRSVLTLEASRIFGTLPYPLLTVYIGNQTFVYNSSAYNQMRIFEFITDRSASLALEHHFNGFIFNRVPLLKRLKWREVVGTKLIYGTLAQKNFNIIPKNIEDVPVTQFKTFGKAPYSEVSFGVENILKIFRVDFVWRLTYRNDPKVRNFGVKMSATLTF